MPRCVFKDCKNAARSFKKDGVNYFRFPRDPFRCAEWVTLVAQQRCQELFTPTTTSVVCADHFLPCDMFEADGRVRLVDSAVPCIEPIDASMREMSPNSAFYYADSASTESSPGSSGRHSAGEPPHLSQTFRGVELGQSSRAPPVAGHAPAAAALVDDTGAPDMEVDADDDPVPTAQTFLSNFLCDEPAKSAGFAEIFEVNKVAMGSWAAAGVVNTGAGYERLSAQKKHMFLRDELLHSLLKKNMRLHKRIASLKRQLRAAQVSVDERVAVSQNVCRTLLIKLLRSTELPPDACESDDEAAE